MVRASFYQKSKELQPWEVIDVRDQCPVCGASGTRKAVFVIQPKGTIELLECGVCRACSASHMPRPEVLDEYYSTYYHNEDIKVTFEIPQRLADHVVKRVDLSSLGSKIRILDFGGGDGTLGLLIAKQLNVLKPGSEVEILVVDYEKPNTALVPHGISMRHLEKLEDVNNGYHDVVIASAILEHIPNLNPIMIKLFSILKIGGVFYARTPYMLPMTKIFRNLDLTYPGHVHDLGASFWDRVIDTFKLKACLLASQPSIVETTFFKHPARTVAAYLLKLPAHIERSIRAGSRQDLFWKYVGGWEIFIRF